MRINKSLDLPQARVPVMTRPAGDPAAPNGATWIIFLGLGTATIYLAVRIIGQF